MKTLDLTIIRTLQFVVLLFFTFAVFLWYGSIALIPLAIWFNLTEYFATAFGTALGAVVSGVLIGSFVFYVVKIPNLLEAFLGAGAELTKLAVSCVKRIGGIAESVKQNEDPQEQQIDIALRDKHS